MQRKAETSSCMLAGAKPRQARTGSHSLRWKSHLLALLFLLARHRHLYRRTLRSKVKGLRSMQATAEWLWSIPKVE